MIYRKMGIIVFTMLMLSACQPRYTTTAGGPVMETLSGDMYTMDFTEMNNEVIDNYKVNNPYDFVKEFSIDGSNETKKILFQANITENVSDVALELFVSDILIRAANNASEQDSRYQAPIGDSFGALYDNYAYQFIVTCGEKEILNETVEAGEEIPHLAELVN